MKNWLLLLGVGIVAFVAFQQRERFLPSKAPTETAGRSPAAINADPVPPVQPTPTLTPPPQAASAGPQPTPDDLARKAELAALVSQSQRAALAKYPSLGEATSEMNVRFNYRYKRMVAEYSPRLQDPAWPMQLADECAQAAGVRPAAGIAVTAPPPTPPPVAAAQTVATPPRPVLATSVPSVPAQAMRVSPPAAAQTLAFHPAVTVAPPAPPAPPASNALPFVTLDAVNQNTKNDYTYNWGSYYGWYDISYRQSVGIAINLKNMGRVPAAVKVRWIFFARNGASTTRFIFAASGKELDLTPGQNEALNADSPLIHNRTVNYGWIGERYMYGSKYEGWLVQLLERGTNRVIKQVGSTSYLEDLAKRSEFAATLEDYRSKMHGQTVTGL